MQHQGKVEGQPDDTERRSGQLADGAKRKFPATAAVLLAGTIMLGVAGGWYLARPVPAGPVIEMLSSADVAEGMKTLSAQAVQQASSESRQCRIQFGYITVSTPGNAAGGTVRFRIGAYESPPLS